MQCGLAQSYLSAWLGLLLVIISPGVAWAAPGGCKPWPAPNARFGINVARDGGKMITDYDVAAMGAGWYLDYTWAEKPARPHGMSYMPMIRHWQKDAAWQARVTAAIAANPGALWILGNEPDHPKQDNRTPEEYAYFYHTAYTFIKTHDPTSRIAIAGVTQPTPLRLHYLDRVLRAYQGQVGSPMPVDVWNVHGYILPETAAWGVGIPPGMAAFAAEGLSYTLADHDNLALFASQLRGFRRWLAARGYGDKPLMLSEFGILLPPAHGYKDERVIAFMHYYAYDPATGLGHNGQLFDYATAHLTPVGRAFADTMAALPVTVADPHPNGHARANQHSCRCQYTLNLTTYGRRPQSVATHRFAPQRSLGWTANARHDAPAAAFGPRLPEPAVFYAGLAVNAPRDRQPGDEGSRHYAH